MMKIIEISSGHALSEAVGALKAVGTAPRGACTVQAVGSRSDQLLVDDAPSSIAVLAERGITARAMHPPRPVDDEGVRWWKIWREALDPDTYFDFRCQHHEEVRSVGSLIRVRREDCPDGVEPWSVLADGGVDIRCEFRCHLPTGYEVHLLVPDAAEAGAVLQRAGIPCVDADYRGPELQQGISWWGQWKPALAYAKQVRRPILMSFASPRVEQVPGVW
ncbi:MAG: hypothetical protein PVJ49_04635 [Acidobacteriota bacterium]